MSLTLSLSLSLSLSPRLNLLFWTNILEPSIKQANLNGSNIRRIVTNDGPDDLALDYPGTGDILLIKNNIVDCPDYKYGNLSPLRAKLSDVKTI